MLEKSGGVNDWAEEAGERIRYPTGVFEDIIRRAKVIGGAHGPANERLSAFQHRRVGSTTAMMMMLVYLLQKQTPNPESGHARDSTHETAKGRIHRARACGTRTRAAFARHLGC